MFVLIKERLTQHLVFHAYAQRLMLNPDLCRECTSCCLSEACNSRQGLRVHACLA